MKFATLQEKIKRKEIPDAAGVYFFVRRKGAKNGGKKEILYIGRATSLRDRTKSYFKDDVIHTRGAFIVDMVSQADDVEIIETDSVLEAIILEANLIKEHQPKYNTKEKDDKSFNYVIITREDFPMVQVIRGKDLIEHFPKNKLKYVFGPYPQGGVLREGMKIIRRIFPYRGTKGCAPNQGKPCFDRQIGLCPGVCTGEISKSEYARTVLNIKLFFEGKKGELIAKLEREMKAHAKKREFEQANEIKKTIFALTHIQDVSLIKEETRDEVPTNPSGIVAPAPSFRIEAYDVAHTGGSNVVGVMTVFENKHIKKSDYRMFKIRGATKGGDVPALTQVLDRRLNHSEWTYPNLIVVDGSTAQKNAAEKLLAERGYDISVVAVVKNDRHRPDHILGDEKIIAAYSKEILLLNSEAHRFALKFHRRLRSKIA